MQLHLVQYDIVWEDKPASHRRADALIDRAAPSPGGLIVLPELGDTGFSFNLDAIVDDRSQTWAAALAKRTGCWVQHGWAQRNDAGRGENIAGLFSPDGAALCEAHKLHPFSIGQEQKVFDGGDRLQLAADVAGAMVCPLTCYDLRFPEAFRKGALAGAEVFTVGASWPAKRSHHWRALAIARAIENQAIVAAVNRTGTDPTLTYVGGSLIVSHTGDVLAETDDAECVVSAEVDLKAVRAWRRTFPCLRDTRSDLQGTLPVHIARH
jgi:predicted amidohydrolase